MNPCIFTTFLAQGFVSGAAANVWLTDRLGFGKVRDSVPLTGRSPFIHSGAVLGHGSRSVDRADPWTHLLIISY